MSMSRRDLVRQLNGVYPKGNLGNYPRDFCGESPAEAFGRYVVATVVDLYGETSDDTANLARVAHGLERVAAHLRRGCD